jgi:hypothetical protein
MCCSKEGEASVAEGDANRTTFEKRTQGTSQAVILQHDESFDPRYEALLPLKRVYVPEPLEEAD